MFERILIVDDDTKARERFYEILTNKGYTAKCTLSGDEAILWLAEDRPDLILLDQEMPGMTGLETAKKIREFDDKLKIILLTDNEITAELTTQASNLRIKKILKKDFSSHFMMKEIFSTLMEKSITKEEPPAQQKNELILIVDDNEQIQNVLQAFFEKKGYEVLTVSSGEEAIMEVKIKQPQLVFLDIRMKDMDGLITLSQIKQINESIKVVMLTSIKDETQIKEALKLGAADYITKPCNLEQLEALVLSLFL